LENLKNQHLVQRNAQETNAMVTEVDKPEPLLERSVNLGALNLLTSMVTLLKRNQVLVSIETIAEIQMDPNPFGAILLQDPRDGRYATQ
jgi:hypothetical protein